jgi:hypothetical protein
MEVSTVLVTGPAGKAIFMKILRLGAARLVMTTMMPFLSKMKRRLVSPGGETKQSGFVNVNPGKAFVRITAVPAARDVDSEIAHKQHASIKKRRNFGIIGAT